MGLAKRVIPCLDVTAGRVVKGVKFVELRDAGDPVEIAARYDGEGADELTFLDITASSDDRDILLHVIEAVASRVFIPLTVGGGVRKVEDVRRLLNAGADKVSVNSAALARPDERGLGMVEAGITRLPIDGTPFLVTAGKTLIADEDEIASVAGLTYRRKAAFDQPRSVAHDHADLGGEVSWDHRGGLRHVRARGEIDAIRAGDVSDVGYPGYLKLGTFLETTWFGSR